MNDDEIMKVIKQCSEKGENDYHKETKIKWFEYCLFYLALIGLFAAVFWIGWNSFK